MRAVNSCSLPLYFPKNLLDICVVDEAIFLESAPAILTFALLFAINEWPVLHIVGFGLWAKYQMQRKCHILLRIDIKILLRTSCTMFFFIYYRKLLHVPVLYPGYLQGPTSLVEVKSVYGKFLQTINLYINNATRIK